MKLAGVLLTCSLIACIALQKAEDGAALHLKDVQLNLPTGHIDSAAFLMVPSFTSMSISSQMFHSTYFNKIYGNFKKRIRTLNVVSAHGESLKSNVIPSAVEAEEQRL